VRSPLSDAKIPWHQASALAQGIVGAADTKVCRHRARHKIARMAWAMMVKGERYKEPCRPCGHKRDRAGLTGVM